jgi:hypothetical protein
MGSGGIAPPFLNWELDGGELSASHPFCFTPEEIDPGTHWIGGWMGPRIGLEAVEMGKMASAWNRTPVVQTVICPILTDRFYLT